MPTREREPHHGSRRTRRAILRRMPPARYWIRVRRLQDERSGSRTAQTPRGFLLPRRFEATVLREQARTEFARGWPALTMLVDLLDGRPAIRELTIGSKISGGRRAGRGRAEEPAPDQDARQFRAAPRAAPRGALARYATLGVALEFGLGAAADEVAARLRGRDRGFPLPQRIDASRGRRVYDFYFQIEDTPQHRALWSAYLDAFDAHAERPAAPRRRRRVTDELLERVAGEYRRAIAEGRHPKKAVQAAENVSEPTAGRYIVQARERGHLGPTVAGKKGEIDRAKP